MTRTDYKQGLRLRQKRSVTEFLVTTGEAAAFADHLEEHGVPVYAIARREGSRSARILAERTDDYFARYHWLTFQYRRALTALVRATAR